MEGGHIIALFAGVRDDKKQELVGKIVNVRTLSIVLPSSACGWGCVNGITGSFAFRLCSRENHCGADAVK